MDLYFCLNEVCVDLRHLCVGRKHLHKLYDLAKKKKKHAKKQVYWITPSLHHLLLHLTIPSLKICRRSTGFFMQMSSNMQKKYQTLWSGLGSSSGVSHTTGSHPLSSTYRLHRQDMPKIITDLPTLTTCESPYSMKIISFLWHSTLSFFIAAAQNDTVWRALLMLM